jgi:hypothetical protein
MVSKIILCLVPLLLLYKSSGEGLVTQPKPYDDAEAYEVYSTLLPSSWPWRVAKAKRLVISSESGSYTMCLRRSLKSIHRRGAEHTEFSLREEKKFRETPSSSLCEISACSAPRR